MRRFMLLLAAVILVLTSAVLYLGQSTTQRQSIYLAPFVSADFVSERNAPESFGDDISESSSFVLALSFMEQLTNAVGNAKRLAHIGKYMQARLVLPFVYNSRLYGLPNFILGAPKKNMSAVVPLDSIIDFRTEANRSEPTATFQEFIEKSPRRIIMFNPVRMSDFDRYNSPIAKDKYHIDLIRPGIKQNISSCLVNKLCDCTSIYSGVVSQVEEALKALDELHGAESKFTVDKMICFDALNVSYVSDLMSMVDTKENTQQSYIFTHWFKSSCRFEVGKAIKRNILLLPDPPSDDDGCTRDEYDEKDNTSLLNIVPEKQKLAKSFLRSINIEPSSSIFSAVHVRLEKLPYKSVSCCLRELIHRVKEHVENGGRLVLVTDAGPFGSKSCNTNNSEKACTKVTDFGLKMLRQNGMHPVHFIPAKFHLADNAAIAAVVELSSLSYASQLFLVGGGHFQHELLLHSSRKSRVKEVHSICSPSTLNILQKNNTQVQFTSFMDSSCSTHDQISGLRRHA